MFEGDDWVELHVDYCEEFAAESVGEGEDEWSVVSFCCEPSFDGGKRGEFDLEVAGEFTVCDLWAGADAAEDFFFVLGQGLVVHRPCNGKLP